MDLKEKYRELYALQDSVFETVFENSDQFYLTGGTCLNRFYKPCRYSDGLDFFADSSSIFSFELKAIRTELAKRFKVDTLVETRDFVRWMVEDRLQVDFVNDRVAHCGKVVLKARIVIDNLENIFANKLTAILGRDDAKDAFDLFMIDRHFTIDYPKVLRCARKKMAFEAEAIVYRLRTFPTTLLKRLNLIDARCLEGFDLKPIAEKIIDAV